MGRRMVRGNIPAFEAYLTLEEAGHLTMETGEPSESRICNPYKERHQVTDRRTMKRRLEQGRGYQMGLDISTDIPRQVPKFIEGPAASDLRPGTTRKRDDVSITFERAERLYGFWPTPTCIISDGPYGVSGFPGDARKPEALTEWYRPHISAWSDHATPQTTLWFWNTEVGWATIHSLLVQYGWQYRCCNIWDKGMGHIAGNSNTKTLRMFPIVTEVCVQYVKAPRFAWNDHHLSMQDWLRHEWQRTGLPWHRANEACGVRNAATRKYLSADHLWYYPPVDAFLKLVEYANKHGQPRGRPYFSIDGKRSVTGAEWAEMRAKFHCGAGTTNVWREPQVGGSERMRGERREMRYKFRALHGSQKPLKLIERIIAASTDDGDVVWEPFGGLCPGAMVSHRLKRRYRAAEIVPEFYQAAVQRLASYDVESAAST